VFSRLDGIDAKLDRAEAQMDAFDEIWRTWVAEEQPWGVDREVDQGKRRYIFIFKALKPIPPVFSVMHGETIHNVRSALDHLAAHLVERGDGKITNSTAWPIKKSRAGWRRDVERRRRPWQLWRKQGGGPIKGIPFGSDAWTLIERAQPYVRSDDAGNDPLWTLNLFWNTDKHRLLNAMPNYADPDAILNVFCITPDIEPIEARSLIRPNRPLKDGTKLALYRFPLDRPLPEMNVCRKFRMDVAVGDDEGKDRPHFRDTIQIVRDLVAEAKAL
jgi:hypothetical protein